MKKLLAVIILFFVLSLNLYKSFNFVWADLSIIKNFPILSYDDKMKHKIGADFYNYTLFLKANLPKDAVILVPPSRFPWPQTGNVYYLNYFLYPRKLVYGDEKTIQENKKIIYALMLWGESEPIHEYKQGWPKFPLQAEEILFLKNGKTEIVKKNYDPKVDMKEGIWGVIKIKRD